MPLKVLIIDDHPLFRQGLRRVIESDVRFVVVGEVGDNPSARRFLSEHEVDVLTVDLALSAGSGLDLIHAVRSEHPSVQMLVVTMCDEKLYGVRALRAGAMGFVGKGASAQTLREALDGVATGQRVASEALKEQLAQPRGRGSGEPLAELTDRELDVLRFLAQGTDTSGVASALSVSIKTVETHRANIARKLGVRGTAGLVRAAVALVGITSGVNPK